MTVLVFSDSHGSTLYMRKVLARTPKPDAVIFLGDGRKDIETVFLDLPDISSVPLYKVNGNCDPASAEVPLENTVTLGNKRFFICHGHTCGVKYSLGTLIYKAKENNADAALFGHTHEKAEIYYSKEDINYSKDLYLFNPGSITLPAYGEKPSYGIIEIRENGILFSHGEL